MATRALLIRPNSAALLVVGRLSCLRVTASSSARRSYHLSSRSSSFPTEIYLSCFDRPTRITHCRRSFCIQATDNPASIEPPLIESMEKKIKEQLSADSVIVKDAYGDGRHISIEVISTAFEGKSAVNRQRMVYKAIWEELQDAVHAVDQMTTRTPEEASGK
ncbi:protein BOLA4, chloroplastic/mitochondrial [Primulina tabacum]|uniref:protein BOLA4, chloroplastic/mitochondrial n=1 Tax=Primulina tabacum TaxID=48773 RepID=UPI003F592C37